MIGRVSEYPITAWMTLRDFFNYIKNFLPAKKAKVSHEDTLETLQEMVKPWDVLIIKRNTDWFNVWSALLKLTWANFTHVLVVTKSKPLRVMHATENRSTDLWSWIEEIDFSAYANQFKKIEIVWMRTAHSKKILDHARSLCWREYDTKAALSTTLLWRNFSSADLWNCVELVTHSLYHILDRDPNTEPNAKKKLKHTARPDRLLQLLLEDEELDLEYVYFASLKKNEYSLQ
jgi:hypothetical protein